ncbi:MAG: hypothetical protein U1E63_15130 [Burkholderiales bacterium]
MARCDTATRLDDYVEAFHFYLQQLARGAFDALVLCENSGFDLTPFADAARNSGLRCRTELIGHRGLDHPARFGRGYGEFKLVDYAMQHSSLIAGLGAGAHVWKITGRYKVQNVARLIESQPDDADLYCHCRDFPTRWLDMYLMRWNRRAYVELIQGLYHQLCQDETPTSAEQRFRQIIDRASPSLRIVRRFAHVPRIDGVRGFDNRPYGTMQRKYLARVIANHFTPWLWI